MAAVKALVLLALAVAAPAPAALTSQELAGAVARPAVGTMLPADLPFTDQRGTATTLGRVAGDRPLVLLFADYTCRHLCGPGATLTAQALARTGLVPGQDYALAIVGLDPRDGLAAARAFAGHLADPAIARAAALLVGAPPAIAAATRALGYHAVYDAAADQFAHDASVYVFAADGRLVTLLPELGLQPAALRAALAGAAPPTLGDRIAHLCYGFAAVSGRYATPVVWAMQALAILTLGGLVTVFWRGRRRA